MAKMQLMMLAILSSSFSAEEAPTACDDELTAWAKSQNPPWSCRDYVTKGLDMAKYCQAAGWVSGNICARTCSDAGFSHNPTCQAVTFVEGALGTSQCLDGTDVLNEKECEDAAEAFGKRFATNSKSNAPPHCWLHENNKQLVFNTHPTGGAKGNRKPVCKQAPTATPPTEAPTAAPTICDTLQTFLDMYGSMMTKIDGESDRCADYTSQDTCITKYFEYTEASTGLPAFHVCGWYKERKVCGPGPTDHAHIKCGGTVPGARRAPPDVGSGRRLRGAFPAVPKETLV